MIPRSLRLTRQGFELARGLRRTASPHFAISYSLPGEKIPENGSAVIVAKKIVKGAVTRHLLKRRIRAILRPWSAEDRILIVSARKDADTLSFSEMNSELSSTLEAIMGGHS